MNRNRILFILLISFITMFGFKLDVIAKEKKEKVLTCVYDMGDLSVKGFTLKQDEKGNKRGYTNNTNYNLQNEENYWQAVSSTTNIKPAGALKECPDKVSLFTQYDSNTGDAYNYYEVGGETLIRKRTVLGFYKKSFINDDVKLFVEKSKGYEEEHLPQDVIAWKEIVLPELKESE